MKELRRTNYKHMKVGIIGSRDQLCIHPEVTKESNSSVKIALCRAKVSARTCHFYNNIELKSKEAFVDNGIADIEDLISKGKKFNCCPYYGSKELQKDVDILFTPYNYIIDPRTRKAQDIQLSVCIRLYIYFILFFNNYYFSSVFITLGKCDYS